MNEHLSGLFHAVERLELLSDDLLQAGETEQAIQAIQAAADIQIQLLQLTALAGCSQEAALAADC